MGTAYTHMIDLFSDFAGERQMRLSSGDSEGDVFANGLLRQLLSCYPRDSEAALVQEAVTDPYFPVEMLKRTLFADVDGMRFFINKRRPDLEPVLADELRKWSAAFLRIRQDIPTFFDPETITCIPLDGSKHRLPTDQWCTLCGVCCQIGGVPALPPQDVCYPEHWTTYLTGGAVDNQQLCPFLFQYFGEPRFFCAIHTIKPIGCREFGEEECRRLLAGRNLHMGNSICL